jgi:hypothetical protein
MTWNYFADRVCQVVSVTDPYGGILSFLDRSRYLKNLALISPASSGHSVGIVLPRTRTTEFGLTVKILP